MATERPLKIVFFKTQAGNEPVRDWLKELPKAERKSIGDDVLTVQFAWPVGKPLVDSLGQGIWEIRTPLMNRIGRTLFFVHNEKIILLHGFIKKTKRTPGDDLGLARKRKAQFLQNV